MTRLAATRRPQEAYRLAAENHNARLSGGMPLLFVWDLVPCGAPFDALKFVVDAARPPLDKLPDAEFFKTYGLSRTISWSLRGQREDRPNNIFEGIY